MVVRWLDERVIFPYRCFMPEPSVPSVAAACVRELPAVGKVLTDPRVRRLEQRLGHVVTARLVRNAIDELRASGVSDDGDAVETACGSVLRAAGRALAPSLRRVLNATGIVLHTNLGRAPLSPTAAAHVATLAQGYSNLELDLATGKRGSRQHHLRERLCLLTGAEDVLVVNNNAAAVLLLVEALAARREVIIGRGELIEIGDSFRLPDIMKAGRARLVEVGTTNRTRIEDYRAAITARTALLFKAHTSNFRAVGFTAAVDIEALAALAKTHGLPCVYDLGSGLLRRPEGVPVGDEPCVEEALAAGADLVTWSGDKLLGGAQAGLIAGRRDLIALLARSPIMRALRPGRLIIAALEAVTIECLDGRHPARVTPIARMLSRSPEELHQAAQRLAARLRSDTLGVEVVPSDGQAGGGALPMTSLHGFAVRLLPRMRLPVRPRRIATLLSTALLAGEPPVLCAVREGAAHLDVRTVLETEEDALVLAVGAALSRLGS